MPPSARRTSGQLFAGSLVGTAGVELLTQILHTATDGHGFSDAVIPLSIMAVDLTARAPVTQRAGRLSDALLPALSVAGVFPAQERDGHRLIDAIALVPVPSAAVIEDGADIVVSVNLLGTDPLPHWPGEDAPEPPPERKRPPRAPWTRCWRRWTSARSTPAHGMPRWPTSPSLRASDPGSGATSNWPRCTSAPGARRRWRSCRPSGELSAADRSRRGTAHHEPDLRTAGAASSTPGCSSLRSTRVLPRAPASTWSVDVTVGRDRRRHRGRRRYGDCPGATRCLRVDGQRVRVEDLRLDQRHLPSATGGSRTRSGCDSDTELTLGLSRMTVRFPPAEATVLRRAQPPALRSRPPLVRRRLRARPLRSPRARREGGNRHWWTLVAAGLGLGMNVLDGDGRQRRSAVDPARPQLGRSRPCSGSSTPICSRSRSCSPPAGALGDIFGRRRVFLIGVALFAAASAGCGGSPQTTRPLLVSRAIQGAGAALMIPATLGPDRDQLPARRWIPRAIGLWTAVTGVALALGPVIGGVLTKTVSWRAIFYLNVPLAAITFAIAIVAARESRDERASRKLDFAGMVTLSLGLTAGVLAVIEASSWGWTSGRIIGLFAGCVVALGSFGVIESRTRAPILPLAIFRSLPFLGTNIAGFVLMFSVLGVLLYMAIYMQAVLGFSALKGGIDVPAGHGFRSRCWARCRPAGASASARRRCRPRPAWSFSPPRAPSRPG